MTCSTASDSESGDAWLRLDEVQALGRIGMPNGHSTEAEIRGIPEAAVRPPERVRLDSLLASIAREAGGLDRRAGR
jgi:plasmid stability protein